MIPILIGAGLGLGKGMLDRQQEARDRQMEAQIAAWSPWSGMSAQRPKRADVFGSILQGASTGAMMGQGLGKGGESAAAAAPAETSPWQNMTAAPVSGGNPYAPGTWQYDEYMSGK